MKYFSLFLLLVVVSCGTKEDILLPKSNITVVNTVEDHSPIYMFIRAKEKDTLVEVNRKNEIISTNWIFNIDKRLPLRLVIPEVMKLQQKKREEKAHKNVKAENYYSYADTIGKNLAFIPFTNVFYKMEKPIGVIIFFNKNNEILIENQVFKKERLQDIINNVLPKDVATTFLFRFDKDLSFGSYIQDKIFIESLKLDMKSNQEFIY
jgi:biopolymer transport protein ExbD